MAPAQSLRWGDVEESERLCFSLRTGEGISPVKHLLLVPRAPIRRAHASQASGSGLRQPCLRIPMPSMRPSG